MSFRVPVEQAEVLADRLFCLGASAVAETAIQEGIVTLVADVDPSSVVGSDWAAASPRVLADDRGWLTAWHETAQIWACGRSLEIRPVWLADDAAAPSDRVTVLVDPGAAFGAGSHPTTRGCLAALEPLAPVARRVLDVGSGTGVLGAAALLLGAQELVALDVDAAAIQATAATLAANGIGDRAQVATGPIQEVPGTFDLVLANLLVAVLDDLGPAIVERLALDGVAVLGGLLVDQRDRALAAVRPCVVLEEHVDDQGWLTVVIARPT
jgi:ribosomal protein L11 methyltransferase